MDPHTERPAPAAEPSGPSLKLSHGRDSREDTRGAPLRQRRSYPGSPGHKGDLDTGRIAAGAFAPKAAPIRVRALAVIERAPSSAETIADEIGEHFMIVRARCSELRAAGLIDDSGRRGDGALGGRVVVWRATTALERAAFEAARREVAQ